MLSQLQHKQLKTGVLSNLLMLLTSAHHIYGAIIYHTPWRLHVLFLSVPVMVITFLFRKRVKTGENPWSVLSNIYLGTILLFSVLLIGVFEGLYNHVLKNILFFAGLPEKSMYRIFPPGVYELPNDFLFELSGIAQGIIALLLIIRFADLVKTYRQSRKKFYRSP